uniref:Crinkler effector protein N-terminal domain-containing protein n=1 Tax=Globisporangium ultimum (strain ATCC 200006 / CBS 805.95 / DAOM BR144) TaxID=431595 RepID=K3X0R7_GLOUD
MCALVEWKDCAFAAKFDPTELVGALKETIKEKNDDTITCNARQLQLYLARKDSSCDEWLSVDETSRNLVVGDVTADMEEIIQGEPMDAAKTLQYYLASDDNATEPPQDRIHVLVMFPPQTPGPRPQKKARLATL